VSPRPHVCAAIVTHNRLAILKRCVEALRQQTYSVATIVVVDNGSSDGTADWLAKQGDLIVVRQGPLGPARGLRASFATALEQPDWDALWVADDDAHARSDALERLVSSAAYQAGHIVGSLVVSKHDASRLAFSVPKLSTYNGLLDFYRKQTDHVEDLRAESTELGYRWSMFFNGALLPRSVVEDVGLPLGEFATGGEDTEYFYRVLSHGYQTYLVLDSLVEHPKYPPSAIPRPKKKCLARNTVYIHRRYRRWYRLRTAFRALRSLLTGRTYLLRPIWDGLRGDFRSDYSGG
jgi:rhamnopyranosyl-N-acetylglucosaminyl-diphospho-decaprenol beta-1,3/1,4-galactofuranosyltransferase